MRHVRLVIVVAVALGGFAVAATLLPHSPADLRESMLAFGVAAPCAAVVAWILLTPAMFPGTVLAAASGLMFGFVAGSALALGGAVLGGLAAFGLARVGARGHVERLIGRRPTLSAAGRILERRGFAAVLTARLTPGVPATALHYVAGVSPVRTRAFAAAIAIGALLRTTPYAILGQGLGSGSSATLLAAVASIALGGLTAAVVARRLRAAAATHGHGGRRFDPAAPV